MSVLFQFKVNDEKCLELLSVQLPTNVQYIHCVSKKRTPETFYNFTKIALISIIIGTHSLHMT